MIIFYSVLNKIVFRKSTMASFLPFPRTFLTHRHVHIVYYQSVKCLPSFISVLIFIIHFELVIFFIQTLLPLHSEYHFLFLNLTKVNVLCSSFVLSFFSCRLRKFKMVWWYHHFSIFIYLTFHLYCLPIWVCRINLLFLVRYRLVCFQPSFKPFK